MKKVTICGSLEDGYESTMEHLAWRQIKNAFGVKLILAPRDYKSLEELVNSINGKKVFLIPPGRTESQDLRDYKFPDGEVNFIFGRPGDTMVRYVKEGDDVVSMHTKENVDLMAISMVGIVLNKYYEYR